MHTKLKKYWDTEEENPMYQQQDEQPKREENQKGTTVGTIPQSEDHSPLMRRKEESMEEQNRANEEKDRNPQIQETEREKVGEGAIRKRRTQGEIATKPKPAELKDTQRREEQRKISEERNIKTGNTFSVLQEEDKEPILEEDPPPIIKVDTNEKK